jgi:DNA-binding NarL/FixJ family response regulator
MGWRALTNRERQVAYLITLGFSDKQIANALNISKHTAKTHVQAIFKKFGVRRRYAVASILLRLRADIPIQD